MSELKFMEDVKIILKEDSEKYLYINPDMLSSEIIDMVAKQIYPVMDKILSIFIQASTIDPENSVCITTTCWDGTSVQKIVGRHTKDGDYERISVDFM